MKRTGKKSKRMQRSYARCHVINLNMNIDKCTGCCYEWTEVWLEKKRSCTLLDSHKPVNVVQCSSKLGVRVTFQSSISSVWQNLECFFFFYDRVAVFIRYNVPLRREGIMMIQTLWHHIHTPKCYTHTPPRFEKGDGKSVNRDWDSHFPLYSSLIWSPFYRP